MKVDFKGVVATIALDAGIAAAVSTIFLILGFRPGLFWKQIPPRWWFHLLNALPVMVGVGVVCAVIGREHRGLAGVGFVLSIASLIAYFFLRFQS